MEREWFWRRLGVCFTSGSGCVVLGKSLSAPISSRTNGLLRRWKTMTAERPAPRRHLAAVVTTAVTRPAYPLRCRKGCLRPPFFRAGNPVCYPKCFDFFKLLHFCVYCQLWALASSWPALSFGWADQAGDIVQSEAGVQGGWSETQRLKTEAIIDTKRDRGQIFRCG